MPSHRFQFKEPVFTFVTPTAPLLTDVLTPVALVDPKAPPTTVQKIQTGTQSAIKTSAGMEIRFFMPVLNVPFRLIFAFNPQRGGVLDNNLQLTKRFVVRFAVGTTF